MGMRLLLPALVLAASACSRPPVAAVPSAGPADAVGTAATDAPCDAIERPASGPEGCPDDEPRPDGLPAVDRPGEDRDGDGVEDLLDACPDAREEPGGDGDGCPNPVGGG